MIRTLIRYGGFPLILFGCMAGFFAMVAAGASLIVATASTVLAAFAAVTVCEQLAPEHPERVADAETVRVDLLHSLVGSHGTTALVKALTFGGAAALAIQLSEFLGVGFWPSAWPLPLQILFGMTIGELGSYMVHRACHASPFLWRIHAMHHSPEHLYTLAAGRNHPFNAFLTYGAQTLPMILLGAPPVVVAGAAAFTGTLGWLQHTDADLRSGPLKYLFAATELHKVHHSAEMEASNSNFANNIIVWDLLFGTFRYEPTPEAYGVPGVNWPRSWLGQLATPFTYPRLVEAEGADAAPAEPVESTPCPSSPAAPSRSLAGVG